MRWMCVLAIGLIAAAPPALTGCEGETKPDPAAAAKDAAAKGQAALDNLKSKADATIAAGTDALKGIGSADLDKLKSMATEFTTKGTNLAGQLAAVKDEASAKAAKADVESAAMNLSKYADSYVAADKLPAFKQLLGSNLGQVTGAIRTQVDRIKADPKLNAVLGDVLKDLKLP